MEEDGSSRFQGPQPRQIFTIGHGRRSWESFVEVLCFHGIRKLVDVRAYPSSRKSPHFSREHLEVALAEAGIVYRWEGKALGGFREPREGSRNIGLRNLGLRGYADHMAGEEFQRAALRLEEEALLEATAVMCAEVDPFNCHRALLADYLTARGVTVKHIKSKADPWLHRISPLARVEAGVLVYDGEALVVAGQKETRGEGGVESSFPGSERPLGAGQSKERRDEQ